MTAKVIQRASPTRPSSPFFGNPIDAGRRSASGGRASPTGRRALTVTNYKQCLALEVPGCIAFYRSRPDFSGVDELTLEVKDRASQNSNALAAQLSALNGV